MSPTICLNLVLTSDNPIVFMVLDSVKEHIDHWVIADAGCAEEFLVKVESVLADISGEIVSIEHRDFSDTRNSLLEYSRNKSQYILSLDENMVLKIDGADFKQTLIEDAYFIRKEGKIRRLELCLFRADKINCRYFGRVKEVLLIEGDVKPKILAEVSIQTFSTSEAESQKRDEYETIFEAALRETPNDAHALFNLARVRLGKGFYQAAFELFSQFLALPKYLDDEWRWYAYFSVARIKEALEHEPISVINAYLDAHKVRPQRAEALFELARYYRQRQDYALAYIYSLHAYQTSMPVNDSFDLKVKTYEWDIPAEHALISQKLNKHADAVTAANSAVVNGKVPNNLRDSLLSSRQRSVDALQQRATETKDEKSNHICLLIPFRNAKAYLEKCINTILTQDYENFTATFIDDYSDDGSADIIPADDARFSLIRNPVRKGALRNRMDFILGCKPTDIVFYLDGDDQLAGDSVLSYINQVYNQTECWLTYGQYISQNANMGNALPYTSQSHLDSVMNSGQMRFPIHPITHRAGLFHSIRQFDADFRCFKDDNGDWLFYASDAVLARPLFCLAGFKKIHYCNQALYLYTEGHDSSVVLQNRAEQLEACRVITKRPKLPVLDFLSS